MRVRVAEAYVHPESILFMDYGELGRLLDQSFLEILDHHVETALLCQSTA